MAKRDYYDVLGVSRSATADEIKKAHRKLVRQYHPDVNKNNKSAEEKFKEAQEAYDVLSDTSKRQNYDQFGHAGVGAGGGPGGGPGGAGVDPFEAFRRAQQGRGRGGAGGPQQWRGPGGAQVEDFDFNDFAGAAGGGGGGYGDIFDQLFGGGGRAGKTRGASGAGSRGAAPKGNDIDYPATLTFEQAARGTTLTLQMNRGGKVDEIEVKVPAGVKEFSRLRIKGKGDQSAGGAGDLFIVMTILPHPFYRRDGLDILIDAPISLYEAMLGTKLSVPTLDGPVTLTIPPGTSSGAKLRIKDRGVFRGGEKGDQFVVVKIVVPKELDADDKTAIETLAAKHPINARADSKWNV